MDEKSKQNSKTGRNTHAHGQQWTHCLLQESEVVNPPAKEPGVEPEPAYRVIYLGPNLRRQGRLHGVEVIRLNANRKAAQGRTAAVIDRPEVDLAVIRTIAHAHHR